MYFHCYKHWVRSNPAAEGTRDLSVHQSVVKLRHGFVNISWDWISSHRSPLVVCGLVQLAWAHHQGDDHEAYGQ
jgi:hypothetical protein